MIRRTAACLNCFESETKMTLVTKKPPFTIAGQEYLAALTEWLQDTRLMSEAVYRLYNDYNKTSNVVFSQASWPKPPKKQEGLPPLKEFTMSPTTLSERTAELLKNLWSTRFVFLETLWEEYLEELVKELRHKDTKLFERHRLLCAFLRRHHLDHWPYNETLI
jgi:hypothetical protein